MPRKLKTYLTSIGFFEKAIAAPSMKAAIEAWGANPKAFKQGFAEETDDPAIVAATMEKPGVVLRRAVGTKGAFSENPELPESLPAITPARAPKAKAKPKPKPAKKTNRGQSAEVVSLADRRAAKAAAAYEAQEASRERARQKEDAARQKEKERREEAVGKAEAVLEKARRRHDAKIERFNQARAALDRRTEEEDARWAKEKKKLEGAVRKIVE